MAAETTDTYVFNPESRSTFSPENIDGETKGHEAQQAKALGKPIKVTSIISEKS